MANTEVAQTNLLKGAEWLLKESEPFHTFIPEDFTEEQVMIRDMTIQFIRTEVLPVIDRINNMEPGLMQSLLEKAGELGMLGISLPEEYNGLGKDFVTATIANEASGSGFSFVVALAAHTGLLWSADMKDSPTDRKNTKWVSMVLLPCSYFFRIVKCRSKMCWAKLAAVILLPSIF